MPYPFDLYLTIGDAGASKALHNLFCPAVLPNLRKLTIIATPNRGRDVAPWLVECREIQKQYPFFCHVHSKESNEYEKGVGDNWRQYLLDNLLEQNAVLDIMSIFAEDEKIGVLFPRCYSAIHNTITDFHVPVRGAAGEQDMVETLLGKMGRPEILKRSDLRYSVGTMMWYRPQALQPLFDLGLTYEDFPEEPIPIGGTLAHAIERIFTVLAANEGYRTVQFNEYEEPALNTGSVPKVEILNNKNHPIYLDDPYNEYAAELGIRQGVRLVRYSVRLFLEKKKLCFPLPVPRDEADRAVYEKALDFGIRESLTVLRKTIGFYLFKR